MEQGAQLIIHTGTELTLQTTNDSLVLSDSSRIENNGIIQFKNQTQLFEKNNYPIYGTGHEISEVDTLYAGMNHPSNLGLKLNLAQPQSSRKIYRFHSDTLTLINGFSAVNRYFQIQPSIIESGTRIHFSVDSTELNGLNPVHLKLVGITGTPYNLGGQADNDSLLITGLSDSLNTFTLTETNLVVDTVDKNFICPSDSISISFHVDGMTNSNTEFILYLFSTTDTIVLDTVSTLGTFTYMIDTTIPTGSYQIYAESTPLFLMDTFESTLLIHSIPTITFASSISSCSLNDSLLLNIATPSGGNYTGSFVNNDYFYPNQSGSGNFIIYYDYTNVNGCTASDSSVITIHPSPVVTFANLNSICNNAPVLSLIEGSPSGGIYSGTGVSGSNFDPALTGGNYILTYTFTDTNNCSATDTSVIEVLEAPSIPVITQNINQLISSSATQYQWYLNGVPITGATDSVYNAISDGQYQVEISNGGICTEISSPFNFSYNSISSIGLDQNIVSYPNPASDFVYLETSNEKEYSFQMEDSNGKIILTGKMTGKQKLDLQNLSNGIYFLSFTHENFQKTLKLVIAR